MSEIIYQHYIGKGPEAEALIAEAKEKRSIFIDAVAAFKAEMGYDEVWQSLDAVRGPVFAKALTSMEARKNGLKLKNTLLAEGHCYVPHMGTNVGKELERRFKELSKLRIDMGEYIVKQSGMAHTVFVGFTLANSVAGFKDGVIVVKVPTGNGDLQNGSMPSPPTWLVPCKESEALAALGQ